ncbi:hypothetical protein Nepgr_029253 [Nepenthes gracilis]|uniref:Uncharacterized protein n=1 Tax=Nepenthes gracilis TaxID=150966 RepID=A0AAD3TC42_NEPGR|nr:hypothetical protein Nepgr_029253 [Nepenthes gracilis]
MGSSSNHQLFRRLLGEGELEFRYNSDGPMALPCDVDVYIQMLFESDCDDHRQQCRRFPTTHSSHRLACPSRM